MKCYPASDQDSNQSFLTVTWRLSWDFTSAQRLCWTLNKLCVYNEYVIPLTYLNLHGRNAYYFVYPAAIFQELPPCHGPISRVAAAFAIFLQCDTAPQV